MKIGIISDTHNLVLPSLYQLFSDINLLIHAGDVESSRVLPEIKAICSNLVRVAGNRDFDEYPPEREYRIFTEQGLKFFVVHNLTTPSHMLGKNKLLIEQHRPDIVVFGHMHIPFIELRQGTLVLNPGQAGWGKNRTRTALKVKLNGQRIVCQLYTLEETTASLTSNHTFLVDSSLSYGRIIKASEF